MAYLSEKQVKKDQRKVEDTAASNKPSEVEKDFAAFVDEDRLDACEKMQKIYGSEEESDVGISYPRLACMIFEVKYSKCFSYVISLTLEFRTVHGGGKGGRSCPRQELNVLIIILENLSRQKAIRIFL